MSLTTWTGRLRGGDTIRTRTSFGTLGLLMRSGSDVYGLTAGHVLEDEDHEIEIVHRASSDGGVSKGKYCAEARERQAPDSRRRARPGQGSQERHPGALLFLQPPSRSG